jgi:mRNA interferase RelE/StbE
MVMNTTSLGDAKAHFSDIVKSADTTPERTTITKNGKPVAIVISYDDPAGLEETIEILSARRAWPSCTRASRRRRQASSPQPSRCAPCSTPWASPPSGPCFVTYEIKVASSAWRSLNRLPTAVQAAALAFIYGPLAENPQRVGKPLKAPLGGLHVARRGQYRVTYDFQESRVRVVVVSDRASGRRLSTGVATAQEGFRTSTPEGPWHPPATRQGGQHARSRRRLEPGARSTSTQESNFGASERQGVGGGGCTGGS